jgi:hypothetical protein
MIAADSLVEHAEFGMGRVLAVLGETATVDFFGESIDVELNELLIRGSQGDGPLPTAQPRQTTDVAFRKAFEAVNLGIVPSEPEQLVKLTIGGEATSAELGGLLRQAADDGLCRLFMGYYGSGKSHHLQLVKAVALNQGWVTASIELDPKAADPAKPSTVYQALMSGLEFPEKADGHKNADFLDLVKEIRDNWNAVRSQPYFRQSPWFSNGLEALLHLSHRRDNAAYVAAVSWLQGQVKQISAIRSLSWSAGHRRKIPSMPQTKDNGLVYAFHLVVLNEVLKTLGYKGLALIIDEAEHVRTYSFNRYVRANNFFDIIARCAHRPLPRLKRPDCDFEYDFEIPTFWKEGPHFALFVGLTEGADTQDLKRKAGELSVLIHDEGDVVHLTPPEGADYELWCDHFMGLAADRLGSRVEMLRDPGLRARVAATLRREFESAPETERILRNWTKMAGFAPALLMTQEEPYSPDELVNAVSDAARQIAGEMMPWDE